jgi:hypothetical protein
VRTIAAAFLVASLTVLIVTMTLLAVVKTPHRCEKLGAVFVISCTLIHPTTKE